VETSYLIYLYLILAGIFGGILAGMFGMGGGVVYTFIIPFFFSSVFDFELEPETIIANSFVGIFFASLSSIIKIGMDGQLAVKKILIASFFAIIAAHLSNHFIVKSEWFSLTVFRTIVLILISIIAIRLFMNNEKEAKKEEEKSWNMPLVGIIGGFVAALSGLGGGVVMVPMMLFLGIFDMKTAKNISSGIIVLSSLSIILVAFLAKNVEAPMLSWGKIFPNVCLFMVIGTLIGGPLGVMFANKMENKKLIKSYLILLLLLMLYYLYKILG
jgi:uncharacterized protein